MDLWREDMNEDHNLDVLNILFQTTQHVEILAIPVSWNDECHETRTYILKRHQFREQLQLRIYQ